MADDYKDTLNLPKTKFPMRANLVAREPERIAHWEKTGLYPAMQKKNAGGDAFILHDGPPFTNGDVHIGTALNKILKDIIMRYKAMRGFRTPYIPGWDCHGLPIEHRVAQKLSKEGETLSPVELRQACMEYAKSYIEIMRKQFNRLGVLADWKQEYRTIDPHYEATVLRTFASFVEKGLIYRAKRPVLWSIPCQTALAEAEIEYKDHKSPSIWVKFPIPKPEKLGVEGSLSIVIWTTTPWTLPANLAIAVHPNIDYVEVSHGDQTYIVADELAQQSINICKLDGATLGKKHKGSSLEHLESSHPFIDRASPVILAHYVTTETGTGCVHTAPGHGLEDYLSGLKKDLEIYSPLDDKGCFIDDGRIPSSLIGLSVLEDKGIGEANESILKILKDTGTLLHSGVYEHQYPHCWRSKTPVIFRAMDQWFISLDKYNMRQVVLDSIRDVKWLPAWSENRISSAVESRPDWCISRQRSWGVPIPVFYDEDNTPYIDAGVIHGIANKIEQHGSDFWFENDSDALLDGIDLPESWHGKSLKRGTDTLDVWIDSGCSHRAILQKHPELKWPANVYLEGSDQHRGWFQSSLWMALVADQAPPYEEVISHGFLIDLDRKKISKSGDKPLTSDSFVNRYGADIIRFWVSSEDYRNDIMLSEEILSNLTQTYRLIRNTLRFQISNLFDFDVSELAVPLENLLPLDKWALHKTAALIKSVTAAYDAYEFHKVHQLCNKFCSVTLSATYHDILKDRLYTFDAKSHERRSAQTAIHLIFDTLTKILAPILVLTMDEAYAYAQSNEEFSPDSIHLQSWPLAPADWSHPTESQAVDNLLTVGNGINEKLEALRMNKEIGQSLDAAVTISGNHNNEKFQQLQQYEKYLPELFIVSQVYLQSDEKKKGSLTISARHAEGDRCPRCWRWLKALEATEDHGEICSRCVEAISRNN